MLRVFYLSSSVLFLSLDVTTPRDAYSGNYREPAALLTLSECFAKGGFEPMSIGSLGKSLTTELS